MAKKWRNYNYKKLDKEFRWKWKHDWQKAAEDAGYQYITEAIVETYRREKTFKKTADVMRVSWQCIKVHLMRLNEPILTGPGGAQNTGSRHPKWKEIAEAKEVKGMSYPAIARKFNVSSTTASNYYHEYRRGVKF